MRFEPTSALLEILSEIHPRPIALSTIRISDCPRRLPISLGRAGFHEPLPAVRVGTSGPKPNSRRVGYRQDWIEELGGEVDVPDPDRSHFVLPLILSPLEILELLRHAPSALRLHYAAALRPDEPWQLGPLEGNVLTVQGRPVVLDEQTAQEFPNLHLPSGPEELTAWLQAAAERSGLLGKFPGAGRRLTLNALRHASAAHFLANGMDLITLYHQLGHQWIDLTQIYVRTAVTNQGSAYAAAHPLMQGRLRPPACWSQRAFPLVEEEEDDDDEEELLRGAPFARLTLEEVQLMLESAKKERERTMVRTFYASGIRQGELLHLRFLDLRPHECSLFIRRGKKQKDRYVLVDPETMDSLLALRGQKPQDARIFPLSVQVAHRYLQEIARRTGLTQKYAALGQRVSAHSLRNTFATHCYLGGMSLLTLRLLLGHSTLASTLDYLECSPQHRQRIYEASRVS